MEPVIVHGFEGLKTRMESQKKVIQSVNENMDVLNNAIKQTRLLVSECDRMARQCDAKQAELEEKLIRVIGKLESKSAKSQVVVTNEAFVETLVKLQRAVTLPSYPFALLNALPLPAHRVCRAGFPRCTMR